MYVLQLRVVPAPKGKDGVCLSQATTAPHQWFSLGLDVPAPSYGEGSLPFARADQLCVCVCMCVFPRRHTNVGLCVCI